MKLKHSIMVAAAGLAMFVGVGLASATTLTENPVLGLQGPGLSIAMGGVGTFKHALPADLSVDIGGTVQKAILYWGGFDFWPGDPGDQFLRFNGNLVAGTLIGTEVIIDGSLETQAFGVRGADVTGIVQADFTTPGSYSFTIDDDGDAGNDANILDGVTLVVEYIDENDPASYRVIVFEGADYAFGPRFAPGPAGETEPVTFMYDPSAGVREAQLLIIGGGAEASRPETIEITDNASILDSMDSSDGPQWDTDLFDITIPADVDATTVQLISDPGDPCSDSLLWILGALRVPCSGRIGDFVWQDDNRDGIQDANEPGIEGVTVKLTDSAGNISTMVTDADGGYLFTGLCAGDYMVEVDETTVPDGFLPTLPEEGGDPGMDSNVNPSEVTLTTDDSEDLTIDFGFIAPCSGRIGDFVWEDEDRDGIQDANEPGIGGVTVKLMDSTGNIATVVTDANGGYLFTGLCAGDYMVEVDETTVPDGFLPTLPEEGGDPGMDSNVNPSEVTLTTDDSEDLTIDFGFSTPCELKVSKSCFIATPPSGDFTCQKPIDALTMIWNGPIEPIRIIAWKGDVDTIILNDIDDIAIGDEVTVSGYAGSQNDVIWEIFEGGSLNKIGESTFHLSCSDADMNGAEDCGKPQGDGKGKAGFLNRWLLDGMVDKSSSFDCTPTPPIGISECEILAPPPPPHCLGKVKSMVLRYLGGDCTQTTNTQEGKAKCDGDAGTFEPVAIVITKDADKVMATPDDQTIRIGDVFTINTTGNELRAETSFDVVQDGSTLQSLSIHTSCSKELNIGDRFGSVEVVGLNTTNGGAISLGAEVEYSYLIENTGLSSLFGITVFDDVLGEVPGSPIQELGPGESVTVSAKSFVDASVTNIATVTTDDDTCFATASATVDLIPRPPTECIVSGAPELRIGDNKFEWKLFNNGTETITVESVSLSWPPEFGNLRKIKLDGDTIFEEDVPPPAATVDLFIGDLNKRQIKPGDDRKLICEFREKTASTQFDFSITVNFVEGCSVEFVPGLAPFTCSKPIDGLSMIWHGADSIRVKAWKGNVGSTLLVDMDNIMVDDEFTVIGYAGSPNDVYWEIFHAGTDSKIGESTFHLSCSDPDMNGPEDCGKSQGDGKDRPGFLNDWGLQGMVDSKSILYCQP